MKEFILIVASALAMGLGGCALMAPADIPVEQTLPKAAQEAQTIINEANIAIIATANVLQQNEKDGVMTREEVASYAKKLRALAVDVDKTQDLLRLGDLASAKTQADLLQKALIALHREVAEKARKQ